MENSRNQVYDFQKFMDFLILYISTSKENPKYKNLSKLLQRTDIQEKLNSKNIKIFEHPLEDKNRFNASLYNVNMNLLQSFDDIDEKTLSQILDMSDKFGPKIVQKNPNIQSGGQNKMKHKYKKYKQKYKQMKGVITKYADYDL